MNRRDKGHVRERPLKAINGTILLNSPAQRLLPR